MAVHAPFQWLFIVSNLGKILAGYIGGAHHFDLVKTLRTPPDAKAHCGFFPTWFVIFLNTIRLRIARQGFLRGIGIAIENGRRALRGHATQNQ